LKEKNKPQPDGPHFDFPVLGSPVSARGTRVDFAVDQSCDLTCRVHAGDITPLRQKQASLAGDPAKHPQPQFGGVTSLAEI